MRQLRDIIESKKKVTLADYMDEEHPRADGHYKLFSGGCDRFHLDGHGYFSVGAKIKTHEVYSNITDGEIVAAHYASKHAPSKVTYTIRVNLPKGHPEAYDENGDLKHDKYFIMHDNEVTKYNPGEK